MAGLAKNEDMFGKCCVCSHTIVKNPSERGYYTCRNDADCHRGSDGNQALCHSSSGTRDGCSGTSKVDKKDWVCCGSCYFEKRKKEDEAKDKDTQRDQAEKSHSNDQDVTNLHIGSVNTNKSLNKHHFKVWELLYKHKFDILVVSECGKDLEEMTHRKALCIFKFEETNEQTWKLYFGKEGKLCIYAKPTLKADNVLSETEDKGGFNYVVLYLGERQTYVCGIYRTQTGTVSNENLRKIHMEPFQTRILKKINDDWSERTDFDGRPPRVIMAGDFNFYYWKLRNDGYRFIEEFEKEFQIQQVVQVNTYNVQDYHGNQNDIARPLSLLLPQSATRSYSERDYYGKPTIHIDEKMAELNRSGGNCLDHVYIPIPQKGRDDETIYYDRLEVNLHGVFLPNDHLVIGVKLYLEPTVPIRNMSKLSIGSSKS